MNLKPLRDRVVVKKKELDNVSAGGIILPGAKNEKPHEGVVTEVGPGKITPGGVLIPIDLKVGDQVIYDRHAGTSVKVEGQEYVIIREEDVLGVCE